MFEFAVTVVLLSLAGFVCTGTYILYYETVVKGKKQWN